MRPPHPPKPILRLNPDRDFRFWLRQYNHFLPNPNSRWCTRKLKLAPFEEWVRPMLAAGDKVTSYVAIRADEDYREGYRKLRVHLCNRYPVLFHNQLKVRQLKRLANE